MKKRRIAVAATVLVSGAVATAWFVGLPLMRVGIAYKAHTLCAEVFVAGHSFDSASADMEIDDLPALRFIHAAVDQSRTSVSANWLGRFERRANFQPEFGCTLEPAAISASGESQASQTHQSMAVASLLPSDSSLLRSGSPANYAVRPPSAVQIALSKVLADAFQEPDSAHQRRTRAIVVMQHGRVIAERYARGIAADTPLPGWSMTKSVLNALVGIAVREGKLALNAPTRLKAWQTNGDSRAAITVNDLLHMSSGLHFDEDQAGANSDVLRMLFQAPDMAAFASAKPLEVAPGTRWQYSSGSSIVLSQVLREALGDSAYHALPRNELFAPLGLTHAVLEIDAYGTFVASSYMYATAREWARFGQLFLQDGVWNGTRILPEGWVMYSRTPAPANKERAYGALFWLATPEEYRGPAVALPPDRFQAIGHEGQFVTIIPSIDVVIVRMGRTRYAGAWSHDQFVAAVLAALATNPNPS